MVFGFQVFPRIFGTDCDGWKSEIRNPKSEFAFLMILILGMAFFPTSADAKLVIFTDGRVLKVADARLDGAELVLELRGGGSLSVSAVRVDRVIADEVDDKSIDPFEDPSCRHGWRDDPLPPGLPFRDSMTRAARAAGLNPYLVAAVVRTESAFDPLAVSKAGAAGLMQLMPAAAADREVEDVFDPEDNLRGGAEHLRLMIDRFESLTLALAAYNAGATTVERYGDIPPYRETRNYVRKVLALFCPEG